MMKLELISYNIDVSYYYLIKKVKARNSSEQEADLEVLLAGGETKFVLLSSYYLFYLRIDFILSILSLCLFTMSVCLSLMI